MDPSALGRYLRESREAKELTLEDAVGALRIRRGLLEAFERGEFDGIESPVQLRGMLRNYARYLGLDEERVLQYYESAQDSKRRRKRFGRRVDEDASPTAPRKITDTPPALPAVRVPRRQGVRWLDILRAITMLLVSIAAIAVIGVVTYDLVFREDTTPATIEATAPAESPTPTATYTASWTPMPSNTPVPSNFGAQGIAGLQVDIEILQRTWLQVTVDGTETFTGIMQPGEREVYEGSNIVAINVSNAAALSVIFNGDPQPLYGSRGQQVQLDFTAGGVDVTIVTEGEATETPTVAPSSTLIPTEAASGNDQASAPATQQVVQAIATPTSLFGGDDTSTAANSAVTPTNAEIVITVQPVAPDVSPTPTSTPTAEVALPIRATPANPTATKFSEFR